MRGDSKKAIRLAGIADDVLLLGNWLKEAAKGGAMGLPGHSAMGEVTQRYEHWLTAHYEDMERARVRATKEPTP